MGNPPTTEYGRPDPVKKTSAIAWVGLVAFGFLLVAMVGSLYSPHRGAREKANQVKCASNLRQIGQAVFLYARANEGYYPPDLQTGIATQQVGAEGAICPSTADVKAVTPTGLTRPGCCSYVYVGAGLAGSPDPKCVTAIEDPANHKFEGCNILYADGHVEWVSFPMAMQTLNDLSVGKNPPSGNTTLTQSAAEKDYEKNWRAQMSQLKTGVWHIPTTLPAALFTIERPKPPPPERPTGDVVRQQRQEGR